MQMGTGEFSGKPGEMLKGNHVMNWHSIQEEGGGGVGGSNTPSRYMLWKPAKAPIGWASRLEYRLYLTYLH